MSLHTWEEPQNTQLTRANERFAPTASLIQSARPTTSGIVIALIPAHNEEGQIGGAIRSLQEQDAPPDLVVVCADNCTDGTALEAVEAGAYVFETVTNEHKKAGALNQALAELLPELADTDAVLVMDADSVLAPTFVSIARAHLRSDVGGVGGVFTGRPGGGFVGMLQRNEYARYARDVTRQKGKVLVLTGTATLFSAGTLRHVAWARSEGLLPGGSLQVYDTAVLTEDNELTLALLHLGYTVTSPEGCRLTTEVMESWGDLYRQRLRWKRGAIENLFDYGLTRVTVRYWLRQLMTLLGIVVTLAYLVSLGVSLAADGAIQVHPLWMAVTGIFIAERVVTVRSRGALQMLFAAVLLVEMTFDVFLQLVHARAIWDSVRRTERGW
ncbi:MAG: glycosyltransferase family 2 protein [Actinobacteria bacterium]|nr:MAG: glycosyltransferase family 2 protein [Actinomycetota bacterium]